MLKKKTRNKANKKMIKQNSKKAVTLALEEIIKWIIIVVILAILVIGAIILFGKGSSAIDFIKNLFRFGK